MGAQKSPYANRHMKMYRCKGNMVSSLSAGRQVYVWEACLAGPSECFDVESWGFDLSVHWHAFVLPTVEEILALVAHKSPFCKRAASVATRCCGGTCWLCTGHCVNVDALLLQKDLGR